MVSNKISAYIDAELTMSLESMVFTALPDQSRQSDFMMLYLANIEMGEDEEGNKTQTSIESDDSIFLSLSNDYGHIDFDLIKTIHVPGVISSDFEITSYYPSDEDMHMFSNYHKDRPVPVGGGFLQVAICPFGANKIELLNGDIIQIFGTGKVPISYEQGGLKGYYEIPKVEKVLSNDYFKIIKLAIYTRWHEYHHRKYSLNIFSPSMRVVEEPLIGQMLIDDDRLISFTDNRVETDNNNNILLVNQKNGTGYPISYSVGTKSNLYGVGKMLQFYKSDFIDMSSIGEDLGDEFSVHMNVSINEYAEKGTTLFEMGYGVTQSGFQTHHLTLWLDSSGTIRYNGQYSDEHISTGVIMKKNMENAITLSVENQKYDDADDNEYIIFIHLNGKQIWPNKSMLTPTEKRYLWRAKEAYRVLTEVCASLPSPHPVSGGLDSQAICAKKLLQESGFITIKNLEDVYKMYLNRPRASKACPKDIVLNSEENTKIKKFFVAQDSEKDIFDGEYYLDGQLSEVAIFSPSLSREEIELIHLLNIIRSPSVKT